MIFNAFAVDQASNTNFRVDGVRYDIMDVRLICTPFGITFLLYHRLRCLVLEQTDSSIPNGVAVRKIL